MMSRLVLWGRAVWWAGAFVCVLWLPAQADDCDLLASWPFDEGSGSITHDTSGNGYNANLSNITWVDGMCGTSAVEFVNHGIGSNVSSAFDNCVTTAFSIEAWVKFYGLSPYAGYNLLFDARYGYGNYGGFTFRLNYLGHVIIQIGDGTQFNIHYSSGTIRTHIWSHVAAVYDLDNGRIDLYIDGTLDTTVTIGYQYVRTGHSAAIGNNRWAPGDGEWRPFHGVIDDLNIYGRALTADEIYDHYIQVCGGVDSLYITHLPWANECDSCHNAVAQPVEIAVSQRLLGFRIPIRVPEQAHICDITPSDWIIELDWDWEVIDSSQNSGWICVQASESEPTNYCPPGRYEAFTIGYWAERGCMQPDSIAWDTTLSDDPDWALRFDGTAGQEIAPGYAGPVDPTLTGTYIAGDLNLDNAVNIVDMAAMTAHLFGDGPPLCCWLAADVNGDCTLNIEDLSNLSTYLFVGGHLVLACGCLPPL